jgi:hypothetical protein
MPVARPRLANPYDQQQTENADLKTKKLYRTLRHTIHFTGKNHALFQYADKKGAGICYAHEESKQKTGLTN